MNLSLEYFKLLKYIYKNPYINYSVLKTERPMHNLDEILYFLREEKYVQFLDADCIENDQGYEKLYLGNDVHLKSTHIGDYQVESTKSDSLRWKVPLIISIIALLKSFMPEITSALVLLSQLLKK